MGDSFLDGEAIRSIMSPMVAKPKRHSTPTILQAGNSTFAVSSDQSMTPEDHLVNTLLLIEGEDLSFDVFQFVMEMLEDMSKNYISGQQCRNIFGVILNLMVKAAPPIQTRVVVAINQLITSNPIILQFTKDMEWLSELLAIFPQFEDSAVLDELFKLAEILGSYHISVKQVKMIFNLFQAEDTLFKSYYWQNIFPLLQRLWHARNGRPNDYFELDGYNSGIMLPTWKLPSGGYSIATWVNVTSFSSLYTRDSYQPYLFSFLSEEGFTGIEAHFNRGKLVIRTNPNHNNVSKREVRILNYDFAECRWYFIAITHTKKLILSDECQVYVNGESVQHFSLKYPKQDAPLKASRLGTAGMNPEAKNCLRGKMAGFLAFDETLNPDEVRALFLNGPNLFASLKPLEQLVLMPRSRLSRRPNVLFFYSPRATDCSICLEPWTNDTSRRGNMLPGVKTCLTSGIQESLSCVGGIQLLLPLFSSKYRPSSGEMVDVNTKVISLITELVVDNEIALAEMLRTKFFEIMGYLLATDFNQSNLQQGSNLTSNAINSSSFVYLPAIDISAATNPSNIGFGAPSYGSANTTLPDTNQSKDAKPKATGNKWSPQAIEYLDKLSLAVMPFGATNASQTNGPLFRQFFRYIYLNFHIWINADYEVQLALIKSIHQHIKRDPEYFHNLLSISQIMVILSEHYTFLPSTSLGANGTPTPTTPGKRSGAALLKYSSSTSVTTTAPTTYSTSSSSSLPILANMTQIDWSKKSRAQLLELRKTLLGIVHTFIQCGVHLKETKSIISYLHYECSLKGEDKRLITDVLQILLIVIGEKHPSILNHIHKLGNLMPFLPLLKATNEKFRVWTLKVIGKLLQNADSDAQRDDILNHLPSLRKMLEPYPLTTHTYDVLLEMLIGSVSADGLINPVDFALHPSTPPGTAMLQLKNLKLIPVIFQLLNARSDMELRIKVVKDILFYLKKGPENRTKFTLQNEWQTWLLSLMVIESSPTPTYSALVISRGPSGKPSNQSPSTPHHSSSVGQTPKNPIRPNNSNNNPIVTSSGGNQHREVGGVPSTQMSPSSNINEVQQQQLISLITELFAIIFESAFLPSAVNPTAIFEGTAAILKRMGAINGLDVISFTNILNTRVIKTLIENDIVSKCKVSAAVFHTCVSYLTFVESTLFRIPMNYNNNNNSSLSSSTSNASSNSGSLNNSSNTVSGSSEIVGPSLTPTLPGTPVQSRPGSVSVSNANVSNSSSIDMGSKRDSLSLSSSIISPSFSSQSTDSPSTIIPRQDSNATTTSTTIFSERDSTIRYGEKNLLPLILNYGPNGLWVSFTLAQRVLEFVDQLVLNKVERISPAVMDNIPPEFLDRLESQLSRFRTRLVLYSLSEGSSFNSSSRLKVRKDSVRHIKQVIYEGFTSSAYKSLSAPDQATGGVNGSLSRYLAKKSRQWDVEMSDVDSMFHKNLNRFKALLESTPSTHAALFLLAYVASIVLRVNHPNLLTSTSSLSTSSSTGSISSSSMSNSPSIERISAPSKTTLSTLTGSVSISVNPNLNHLHALPNIGSSPSVLGTAPSTPQGSNSNLIGSSGTPSSSSVPTSVQHTDESLQLIQQLWKGAMQNIKQRLINDAHFGPMFSRLEGDVLIAFFENGFANTKDFALAPAIERAVDHIVNNDMNAMAMTQAALKTVAERLTDETQETTLQELGTHKQYEQEFSAFSTLCAGSGQESSNLYGIRYYQSTSLIASEWKYILRVLLDNRGPWSSPFNPVASDKLYWKLDSAENSQRMRIKLKRHYGDVSHIEFASMKNDEKDRQMMESLLGLTVLSPSNSGSLAASPSSPVAFSPSNSLTTLPVFDSSSSSAQTRAELLKLARRTGTPIKLNDDGSGMIDEDFGIGDSDTNSKSSSDPSQSGISTPGSPANPNAAAANAAAAAAAMNKSGEERTLLVTTCEYVKGISSLHGDFEITTSNLYFRNISEGVFKTIPLEKLRMIYSRRFMLQDTALEFFTTNKTSHFFYFDKDRPSKIMSVIVDQRPPNLREYFAGSSQALARKKKHITEAWRKRQISNFEYLMELNTIAGRSYNDLSQYPVFPWIIADYESEKLDLNNPATYRDLSKPIGALEPNRLEKFLLRWDEMIQNADENANTPPFLYGSHYSSHSIVLYYLLRLEPFTTQSLQLQGGLFDLAPRLFTSIPDTWKNCLSNQSDVKELIPEFFYLPSFLYNSNGVNFGSLKPNAETPNQHPLSINNVTLPPWASTHQVFVQFNRMALESDYVSDHLNEWIDLIFGYKQLGQDAIDAHNVFYYTSYEGNIDIESIQDPTLKQSIQMQIREFGQTPSQLFTSPHPTRLTWEECQKAKRSTLTNLVTNALNAASAGIGSPAGEVSEWKPTAADLSKSSIMQNRPNTVTNADIVSISVDQKNERLIIAFMDGLVLPIGYKVPKSGRRFPVTFTAYWTEGEIINYPQKRTEHSLDNTTGSNGVVPTQGCFALTNDGKFIINGGTWDRSVNVSQLSSNVSLLHAFSDHKDIVTCVAISQDHQKVITASKDCNVFVYDLESFVSKRRSDKDPLPKPRLALFGHDDAINSIAVNSDLSVIVTASQDCTCIIYDLNKGHYSRTITHEAPVNLVAISKYGEIVTYCSQGEVLYLHTINGTLLQKLSGVGKLTQLKLSSDGILLITAGQNIVNVRTLVGYTLKRLYVWKCPTSVSSIELFNSDEYLLIGLCDGTLLTVLFDMGRVLTDMARDTALEKT